MDYIHQVLGEKRVDIAQIEKILRESINEKDITCHGSRKNFLSMGLDDDQALMLLALYKSSVKYHYNLSHDSLIHLFHLAGKRDDGAPLKNLFKYPFFIIKTGWLYEHAPSFLFYNKGSSEEVDEFIIKFAAQYESQFLRHKGFPDTWKKVENPRRVKAVTFWENKVIDPVTMIEKVAKDNIEGLELSIDFHPFNYTKILPEELFPEKREEIRTACLKTGIRIDIHSPIVGPYAPFPDPKLGKQLFYNPIECYELMCETIHLAKEIGAGSVVIHLIDDSNLSKIADLVTQASGSDVRVTIENYCQTEKALDSEFFIAAVEKISRTLPYEIKRKNFGITLDVGHLNIEGEDPLTAAEKIGNWCFTNGIYLRLHATDNYGKLLFSPPAYSADVHGNVSGRGINNQAIIKLLRSIGHHFDVIAEQIKPLTSEDIGTIHEAQSFPLELTYDEYIRRGENLLSNLKMEALITPEIAAEKAYQFLAGMEGVPALREHLVYRKIQDKKYLSVDEVKRISLEFMRMPREYKQNMIDYLDDLLLPIQTESGALQKNELDLICQNISGALFGTINSEHLERIFSETKVCAEGDVICEQDSAGEEMYLVKSGEVIVSVNGSLLARLGPGEIFGEISLFYNVRRTATIRAAKDNTTLGILNRNRFRTLLENSEPYSYDLIYRLYHILPDRLRNLNDKYKTAIEALKLIANGDLQKEHLIKHIESRPTSNIQLRLTEEEVLSVFRDLKNVDRDQLIFTEGDSADGAYYILEGRAKAVTHSSDSHEIELGEIGESEVFGEMALIDNKPRSASILTVTPCKIAYIDKNRFNEFITSRSDLSFRFMAFICLSLFRRILRLDRDYADIKNVFK